MPTSQSSALVALCFASALPAAAAEVPYREAWGYGVVVPVRVQGLGPFDFLLDTGSDLTVVHEDLARRLALVPEGREEVATVAGSRAVPRATVRSLAIGPVALGPADVLIHDMRAARAADRHLAGFLGRNALAGVSFTIDHARRTVVLGPTPAAGRSHAHEHGRPVIEARVGCGGEPLRLALDSGIAGILLYEGARPLPIVLSGSVTATTNHGATELRAGRLEALCVGGARLVNVPVAVQARAAAGAPPEDGLLPTRLFARVHFDAQRREVRLEPW